MTSKLWLAATATALLAACAGPPARVISSAPAGAERVTEANVILEAPTFTPAGLAATSLANGGWYSGELERRFCSGLTEHLADVGVQARCTESSWGARVKFGPSPLKPTRYTLMIKPISVNYLVHTQHGRVVDDGWASEPKFDALTRVVDVRSGQEVWKGVVKINIAPIDPTGASRYAKSLVDAWKESGLLGSR